MNEGRKPSWLKSAYNQSEIAAVASMLKSLGLNTVCSEAECPNMGECFKNKTATFMILGNVCTRNCRFCSVTHGKPTPVSEDEPVRLAAAAKTLGLSHTVVTSVTRDDLPDGGARHFANVVSELYKALPNSTVEVLIPDMKLDYSALDIVVASHPTVINHNLETVPSLYSAVRPQANYRRSLEVLRYVHEKDASIYTKSGIMLGLGETGDEVYSLFDDLREVGCDILTMGQYLRPSEENIPMKEYITPEAFDKYREEAMRRGFRFVAAGPLVRSSYKATDAVAALERK